MEINRPYRTVAYRRRATVTKREKGQNDMRVLLTQVGVCFAIFVAAAIFKVAGGSKFVALREEYLQLTNKKITVNAIVNTIDSLSERYSVIAPLSDGIKHIRQVFSTTPPSEENTPSSKLESEEENTSSSGVESEEESSSDSSEPSEDTLSEASQESTPSSTGQDTEISGAGGENIAPLSSADSEALYPPVTASFAPVFSTGKLKPPIEQGRITSRFGYRIHPITKAFGFHSGIDIAAPFDTPIACVLPGKVKETGSNKSYGNYIIVEHSGGFESFYGHCSKIIAQQGAIIRKGEIIAKIGSTGVSTGNHLHFEVRINGICFDPEWLLKGAYSK